MERVVRRSNRRRKGQWRGWLGLLLLLPVPGWALFSPDEKNAIEADCNRFVKKDEDCHFCKCTRLRFHQFSSGKLGKLDASVLQLKWTHWSPSGDTSEMCAYFFRAMLKRPYSDQKQEYRGVSTVRTLWKYHCDDRKPLSCEGSFDRHCDGKQSFSEVLRRIGYTGEVPELMPMGSRQ